MKGHCDLNLNNDNDLNQSIDIKKRLYESKKQVQAVMYRLSKIISDSNSIQALENNIPTVFTVFDGIPTNFKIILKE